MQAATASQPAALKIATATSEVVRIGGVQWLRLAGEWRKTDAGPVQSIAEWGDVYQGATGFALGGQEDVGGRTAQIVMFAVPSSSATAWFTWWVDAGSGLLLREAMISSGHYMVRQLDSFDSAPPIIPPTE